MAIVDILKRLGQILAFIVLVILGLTGIKVIISLLFIGRSMMTM